MDQIEELCKKRALAAFDLSTDIWKVNVQPQCVEYANMAVFSAFMDADPTFSHKGKGKIMNLSVYHGGASSLGHKTGGAQGLPRCAASEIYDVKAYYVNEINGELDYLSLGEDAALYKPNVITIGVGTYPK